MLQRILVPVKGADQQDDQLACIRDHAADGAIEVRVVYVTPVEYCGRGCFSLETPDDASYLVDAAVFELRMAGIGAHGGVRRALVDRVGREVSRDAAEWNPDVIVLGSSCRSPLKRRRLGRIEGRLARSASCPVLVAPTAGTAIDRAHRLLAPRLGC